MRTLVFLGSWMLMLGVGCEPEDTVDAGMGAEDVGTDADADTAPVGTYVQYDLAAAPMDFGAIPFPDDLYRNETGGIELGNFRRGTTLPNFMAEAQRDLRTQNGFSPNASQFFYFPANSLDVASLPADAAASEESASSIWMVDVDPMSATRGQRQRFLVNWMAEDGQLAIRPADGFTLHQGRQYAVVVTTNVRDVSGDAILPNPRFAAIRDAASRPSDALDGRAYDLYTPVFEFLSGEGVERASIAAMTVFTTMTVGAELQAGRNAIHALDAPVAQLYATPQQAMDRPYAPVHVPDDNTTAVAETRRSLTSLLGTPVAEIPGVDNEGGAAHANIGALIHGHFMAPRFDADRPHGHGVLEYETDDRLRVKMMDAVPFTIVLPKTPGPWPVAIAQHSLGAHRTAVIPFANSFAAHGIATIGINLPFHGMRAVDATDAYEFYNSNAEVRRTWFDMPYLTDGVSGADGIGDTIGEIVYLNFLGILDFESALTPFAGAYVRNAFNQSVFDLMSLVRLVRSGDWSTVQTALGLSDSEFGFTDAPISYVAISLGGIVGAVFAAMEPEIGTTVMSSTGGHITHLVEQSPFYEALINLLLPNYGLNLNSLPRPETLFVFQPELAVFQTTLDGADPINFGRRLSERPINILYTMSERDIEVPRVSTESMARQIGLPIVNGTSSMVPLETTTLPLSGNVMVGDQAVTRAMFFVPGAEHVWLKYQRMRVTYEEPIMVPNRRLAEPVWIDNPIAEGHRLVGEFLSSSTSGSAAMLTNPFGS